VTAEAHTPCDTDRFKKHNDKRPEEVNMEATKKQEVVEVGKYLMDTEWGEIEVVVARNQYGDSVMYYPLTPCCGATAKGMESYVGCRSCYEEVPSALGSGWYSDEEWERAVAEGWVVSA
jgi:hypothetical protein